jgi:uroporphyrinogen-III decarboxylase
MVFKLTNKQRFLNTFAKKKIDRIVFSPRLYYWYFGNRLYKRTKIEKYLKSEIPHQYLKKSQLEIYQMLNVAPRYSDETLYLPIITTKINPDANIEITTQRGKKNDETFTKYKTPLGNLTESIAIGGGMGGHYTEFAVKKVDDMKIMRYILENTEVIYHKDNVQKAEEQLGDLGVVSTYLFSSPYQKLVKTTMGFVRTILFLKRKPYEMEKFMSFLAEWDNQMYDIIAKSPLEVINFGENIDCNLSPPSYFEKYLIPYYEKRVKQLHQAGKYCHIHMDGSLKDLLPYLADLPFDGLEALTAKPQGDVTLEELKASIGDKILLDGIPSILFLPEYSKKDVQEYTKKVLEMFSPNLILGISDELSPNGQIMQVEMIADLVKTFDP